MKRLSHCVGQLNVSNLSAYLVHKTSSIIKRVSKHGNIFAKILSIGQIITKDVLDIFLNVHLVGTKNWNPKYIWYLDVQYTIIFSLKITFGYFLRTSLTVNSKLGTYQHLQIPLF